MRNALNRLISVNLISQTPTFRKCVIFDSMIVPSSLVHKTGQVSVLRAIQPATDPKALPEKIV